MGKIEDAKIGFGTTLNGIIAFIANFEKHVHEIHEDIPCYFLNTGDETYYNTRFEKLDDNNEIYKKIPRIVFKLSEIDSNVEQKGNSNIHINYVHENKIYNARSMKIPLSIPLICNFVTSNVIFGLKYFEMLLTLFNSWNVFSYDYMNNAFEGKYDAQSFNFEFPQSASNSEAKDFIINFNINLSLPIYVANYGSITELNPENLLPIDTVGPDVDRNEYSPFKIKIKSKNESPDSYNTEI